MPQDNDARRPDDSSGDELDWDSIFTSQPEPTASRAEAARREGESRRARQADSAGEPLSHRGDLRRERRSRGPRDSRPRRRGWIGWLVALVVVLGLGAGAVGFVWLNFEDQVRSVMGWEIPPEDYEGEGTGEATIVIMPGDTGEDVTAALLEADVIASYEAFWELLLKENPQFFPGYYMLAQQMSAEAALAALQDPENRLENTALIQEGITADEVFELLSAATSIPVEDFEAAVADPTVFGVPAEAPSIEGYLFPARYTFDPGVDATSVITTLVNRTFQSLDAAGVPAEERHRVLTIASLIQREAGSNEEDFYKVSRVIQNRLNEGMALQFDSTAHYGYVQAHGEREEGGVFSTEDELTDPNPFNTYVHTGLPPGPISASGDLAIDAAMHPAEGPWLYFVAVNLDTGETEFNETLSGHNASVEKMRAWCRSTGSPNCG
ncbi:endolytic transglycosylase MltG [Salinibacterium sp. SYSU T00001]|uniref:endolytic transglycosylase MltG n=1 Tax=Homoserinimonas sedimenticola TaxID=2986805 RepID=UPI002236A082|nr:endolytic transglycosylase MltG [Salinibacterium sedimenticola]MCW4384333.1 endolytic transglycosylase MltG [Salinibacterium sedimenticola]